MRYRPFGNSGKAVSAVSLQLHETAAIPTAAGWRSMIYTALESGINCFEVMDGAPVLNAGLAAALPAVDRGLLFLSLRLAGDLRRPLNAQLITPSLRDALQQSGAGYFDLLILDEPALASLTPDGRTLLEDVRAAGLILQYGVLGDGDGVDRAIADPLFEVLATPFSLISDWRTRRLVKDAGAAGMTAMGYNALPNELLNPPPLPSQSKVNPLLRRSQPVNPLAGAGTYAFLRHTQGWTPEEICMAYALTEPAFSTIQFDPFGRLDIEHAAAVPERDMPTGVAAQIEMARFSAEQVSERRSA